MSLQHPRVRHAACTCLGQMSEDFGPSFQRKFHAQVVPGLLCALEDSSTPRVQAQAGRTRGGGEAVWEGTMSVGGWLGVSQELA